MFPSPPAGFLLASALLAIPCKSMGASGGASVATHRLIVEFKNGQVPEDLRLPEGASMFEQKLPDAPAGGRRRDGFEPARFHIVELAASADPEELLGALRKNPAVVLAEPDGIGSGGSVVPNDPDASLQWHHLLIRTPQAWEITRGGPEVILAVLDTGINATLPDFAGRVIAGYDFVNNDADPSDDHGHGSAVAAVAAATGNNGADTAGVDWNCRIMPLKVLDGSNYGLYSNWASAINYATQNGADVINLSAGGYTTNTTLTNAINNAIAQGVIFVTITHNDAATVRFPGSLTQCITVGATDQNDHHSSFSNHGPAIDLVAPGGYGSTGGGFSNNIVTTDRNGAAIWWWGTSFSAPQVSGAACLIRALRPAIRQQEMEAILCAAAIDPTGDILDTPGFDTYFGYGRLDVANAIALATAGAPRVTRTPEGAATLSWNAPGNAASKKPFGIEWTEDLRNWHPVAVSAGFQVSGDEISWTDDGSLTGSPPGLHRFYRSYIRR